MKCVLKSRMIVVVLLAVVAAMLMGCAGRAEQFNRSDSAMGTIITQSVYASDEQSAHVIMDEIIEELDRLENQELSWRKSSSLVYKINASTGNMSGYHLPKDFCQMLEKIFQVSEDTSGALDVTIGAAARLWNIDESAVDPQDNSFKIPSVPDLNQALQFVGYKKVKLKSGRISLPAGMSLDLGAVGKGIACDRILEILKSQNSKSKDITGAVISVGGSILTYGEKPGNDAWRVGIVNPVNTSAYIGSLVLDGEWCVSTSGDYERFVEVDKVRYHHILDSQTGYPAYSGLSSVTVLSKDGCLSDALSTACFVLGKEEALELLKKYDAYAVMVDQAGKIILSPGMEAFFEEWK